MVGSGSSRRLRKGMVGGDGTRKRMVGSGSSRRLRKGMVGGGGRGRDGNLASCGGTRWLITDWISEIPVRKRRHLGGR